MTVMNLGLQNSRTPTRNTLSDHQPGHWAEKWSIEAFDVLVLSKLLGNVLHKVDSSGGTSRSGVQLKHASHHPLVQTGPTGQGDWGDLKVTENFRTHEW
jgi:hypothetical protein